MKRLTQLAGAYLQTHAKTALEYRASLVSQVLGMLLNDVLWLVFWAGYYERFRGVGGWGGDDIIMLWAVASGGFGLAGAVCGNAAKLAGIVSRGELDVYLTMPRPVLSHVLLGRMSLPAVGDVLFAFGAMCFVGPTPAQWLTFLVALVCVASIFVSVFVLGGSLAFWVGRAEAIAEHWVNGFIVFSTYPTSIFRGAVKLLLFTVFPSGFVAYVPVELLRDFRAPLLGGLMAYSAFIALVAWWVFQQGLQRYASGNLGVLRE